MFSSQGPGDLTPRDVEARLVGALGRKLTTDVAKFATSAKWTKCLAGKGIDADREARVRLAPRVVENTCRHVMMWTDRYGRMESRKLVISRR